MGFTRFTPRLSGLALQAAREAAFLSHDSFSTRGLLAGCSICLVQKEDLEGGLRIFPSVFLVLICC